MKYIQKITLRIKILKAGFTITSKGVKQFGMSGLAKHDERTFYAVTLRFYRTPK